MNRRRRSVWCAAIIGVVIVAGILAASYVRNRMADQRRAGAEALVAQCKGVIEEAIQPFELLSRALDEYDVNALGSKKVDELLQIKMGLELTTPSYVPSSLSQVSTQVLARLDASYTKASEGVKQQPDVPLAEFHIAYWKCACQQIANGIDIDAFVDEVRKSHTNEPTAIESLTERLRGAGAWREEAKLKAATSVIEGCAQKVVDDPDSPDSETYLMRSRIALVIAERYGHVLNARMDLSERIRFRQKQR